LSAGDKPTAGNGNGSFSVRNCELGFGLFAERSFLPGDFLFEFSGPVISLEQAIAKGDSESNALQVGPALYVDVQPPSVFANHSCDPNSCIRNDVQVFALRDIAVGEEVCFDYSTTMSERRWTMRCLCGTAACRGVVTDFHDLPVDVQDRYLALNAVQAFIQKEAYALRRPPTTAESAVL
jgi:uncharacterized protein